MFEEVAVDAVAPAALRLVDAPTCPRRALIRPIENRVTDRAIETRLGDEAVAERRVVFDLEDVDRGCDAAVATDGGGVSKASGFHRIQC